MTPESLSAFRQTFAGHRVLVTGHTGFKGAWLTIWLHTLGAQVTGLSLAPDTTPNLYTLAGVDRLCRSRCCDIRDHAETAKIIRAAQPEFVFHLAAQALVHAGYRDPIQTFSTNVQGTVHVLEALRGLDSVKVAVAITTDKVYRVQTSPRPCVEEDELGGHDPYSASKAACEHVIASYRDAYLRAQGTALASARAGNVIGGGDWSADRLIPDAVRAWGAGQVLEIRRPQAIRPWQHVLEPLAGYLQLAQALSLDPHLCGAYNFGPDPSEAASVKTLVEEAREAYGSGEVSYGDGSEGPHEAAWLALDNRKACAVLGFEPQWDLSHSIQRTMRWYRDRQDGAEALGLCMADIGAFEGQR